MINKKIKSTNSTAPLTELTEKDFEQVSGGGETGVNRERNVRQVNHSNGERNAGASGRA